MKVTTPSKQTFGNRVREWREKRGLTIEALAKQLKHSTSTQHRYETGARPLTVPMLERLAVYLAVGAGDLLLSSAKGSNSQEDRLLQCFRALSLDGRAHLLTIAIDLEKYEMTVRTELVTIHRGRPTGKRNPVPTLVHSGKMRG